MDKFRTMSNSKLLAYGLALESQLLESSAAVTIAKTVFVEKSAELEAVMKIARDWKTEMLARKAAGNN